MEKQKKGNIERPNFSERQSQQRVFRFYFIKDYGLSDVDSFRLYANIIMGHSLDNMKHRIEFYLLKHPNHEKSVRKMLEEGLRNREHIFSDYLKVYRCFSNSLLENQNNDAQIVQKTELKIDEAESHQDKSSQNTVHNQALKIIREYIIQNKAPDRDLVRKLSLCHVSQNEAYRLYRLEKWGHS